MSPFFPVIHLFLFLRGDFISKDFVRTNLFNRFDGKLALLSQTNDVGSDAAVAV